MDKSERRGDAVVIAIERKYAFPHSDHLSPSQITEYLSCPECFRLNRIDRVPHPLSVALPIGGAVHKAVELQRGVILSKNAEGRLEEAIDAAAWHFDKSLDVEEVDLSGYGSVGEAKDHAVAITRYVLPEIAKLDAQRGLVAAELDLRDFDNPWPFPMHGRVDALYGPSPDLCHGGADMKTASKQAKPAFAAALQIAIYRSFLPVTWFIDQVAKTKVPSLVTYVLSDDGDEFVRALVLDVADRIARGDFPPRPGFLCKYAHPGPSFSVTVEGYNNE
jgi:PD-(D/E)XK nuclease superfamily